MLARVACLRRGRDEWRSDLEVTLAFARTYSESRKRYTNRQNEHLNEAASRTVSQLRDVYAMTRLFVPHYRFETVVLITPDQESNVSTSKGQFTGFHCSVATITQSMTGTTAATQSPSNSCTSVAPLPLS